MVKKQSTSDLTHVDVCFIGSKYIASFVIVVVYERFYAGRGGFTIVGNLLVGDADAVYVLQCLSGFTKR